MRPHACCSRHLHQGHQFDAAGICDGSRTPFKPVVLQTYKTDSSSYLHCRRYEKAQKPLSAFDADISKYADLSEEVLAENAAESIKFLFVDCGPLKQVSNITLQIGSMAEWDIRLSAPHYHVLLLNKVYMPWWAVPASKQRPLCSRLLALSHIQLCCFSIPEDCQPSMRQQWQCSKHTLVLTQSCLVNKYA